MIESATESDIDFRNAFNQLPGNFIILKPDSPCYTIIGVSDDLLSNTGRERQDVIGKSIFEVFPGNPDAVSSTGPSALRSSLQTIIKNKKPDQMPTVRYDVALASGAFEERYWLPVNKPVIDSDGEVAYIIHSTSEITAQVKATQKAVENEQKLDNLLENAPFPVAVYVGREMRIQLANQAMIDAYGKGSSVIGRPYRDVLPEMGQEIFKLLEDVLLTGIPFHAKNQRLEVVVHGQPQIFYYHYSFTPLFDSQGKVYGIMNTAADVTELNLAQKKLKESESRFRNMIAQAPVAIGLTHGYDHIIDNLNTPMLRIFGKKLFEEVVGKNLPDVLPEIKNQPVLKIFQNLLDTGEVYTGNEVPVILKSGEKLEQHFFNVSYTPFIEEGKVTGIIHLAVDVTEQVSARKKIEDSQQELKRFKFMADQARDAFILIRDDASLAYLNQKALESLGYTEEEAMHLRIPDIDPTIEEEVLHQVFQKVQNESVPPLETLHITKTGQTFPVEVNAVGLMLDGKPYVFSIARDISERKNAEKILQLRNDQLLHINNDLDNFIYTASHDLKAPISNIEGLLHVLLLSLPAEAIEQEQVHKIIQMMQDSVERFKKTIGSLTDVVKLQKENSWEAGTVHLAGIVKGVLMDLEPLIKESGAQVEVDVDNCPSIRFSEKNLRSVIYNLLSNAIKYRSTERVSRVKIWCESISGYEVLIVKDNGVGIKKNNIAQLFTMFKRFHTHVEGTGVGLYMIKKMIENAGGRIEVESLEGEGTTFRVYFLK